MPRGRWMTSPASQKVFTYVVRLTAQVAVSPEPTLILQVSNFVSFDFQLAFAYEYHFADWFRQLYANQSIHPPSHSQHLGVPLISY